MDITDYVFHGKIQDKATFQKARTALLDAMGCAIETVYKSESCRRLLGPPVPQTFTFNGFKLPGTSYRLDPLKGAFDMATIIRYLDHNDAIAGADWGHPSGEFIKISVFQTDCITDYNFIADNIGAILAVMDWLSRSTENGKLAHNGPPLTIKTLLTAVIKAYEIQGCFLLQNSFNSHGLDHVILVKLASTAVVCWLLGLTEVQTMAAISHVWMDGHPLRVYRSGPNTIPRKGWAAGEACMKAVQLAWVVRAGQPGSPTVLTMPRWGFYDAMFGGNEFVLPVKYDSWVMNHILFKILPVEGHAVAAVESALILNQILRERSLRADMDILRIDIRTNAAANMIINKSGPLYNSADRDHCMQYIIALTFLKGAAPEAQDFMDDSPWASNPTVDLLRNRINIHGDAQLTQDYMDLNKKSISCGLTVYLADNNPLDEVLVEFPVGHAANPRTSMAVKEKFRRNMSLLFSEVEIEEIYRAVEQDDMKIFEFVDLFVRENVSHSNL